MDNATMYICLSCAIAIVSFIYLRIDPLGKFNPRAVESRPTSYENANEALNRMSSWATWLSGLQTAAMAAMALISKDIKLDNSLKIYGFLALLFMGTCIILTTWVLSSLPSIQQRLVYTEKGETTTKNDIYNFDIYGFINLRLGPFTGLSHFYFLVGILFWGIFILNCLNAKTCPKI
jgi:hypothetical protein